MSFFGCYLLESKNPQARGRSYIGFTVNPQRRIRQHNGEISNGAYKTKKWRPWEMTLVVHGFATQTAALQFEWAWQHPEKSLDTREAATAVGRKARYGLKGKIFMMLEMLNCSPWKHYPLKILFLKPEYAQLRAGAPSPPPHIEISVGSLADLDLLINPMAIEENDGNVDSEPTISSITATAAAATTTGRKASACCFCKRAANRTWAVCSQCGVRSHVGCLAGFFLQSEAAPADVSLPNTGSCLNCGAATSWTEILNTLKHAGWGKTHSNRKHNGDSSISDVVVGASQNTSMTVEEDEAAPSSSSTTIEEGEVDAVIMSQQPWLDAAPPALYDSPDISSSSPAAVMEAPPWDDFSSMPMMSPIMIETIDLVSPDSSLPFCSRREKVDEELPEIIELLDSSSDDE